jgi:hypothetical protein
MWRAPTLADAMTSQGRGATAPVWLMILFRVLAVLAGGFFVVAAVPEALSPWRAVNALCGAVVYERRRTAEDL